MAEQEQLQAALAWTLFVGRCIALPFWYCALAVSFLLRVLYQPVAFLLLPVTHLGRFLLACLALPFTAAARFETVYIFLGVAAVVGIVGGLGTRALYGFLYKVLRLGARSEPELRTAKQYREEKRRQKMHVDASGLSGYHSPTSHSPGSLSLSDSTRKGKYGLSLLERAITEEDDSEF